MSAGVGVRGRRGCSCAAVPEQRPHLPLTLGRGGCKVLLSPFSNRERSSPSVPVFLSPSCRADQPLPWVRSVFRSLSCPVPSPPMAKSDRHLHIFIFFLNTWVMPERRAAGGEQEQPLAGAAPAGFARLAEVRGSEGFGSCKKKKTPKN